MDVTPEEFALRRFLKYVTDCLLARRSGQQGKSDYNRQETEHANNLNVLHN
jgi:hypothetical protein